jgi:hypothetical protein
MAGLKIGTTDVSKVYVGSTPASKVYIGSDLAWSAAPPPTGPTVVATDVTIGTASSPAATFDGYTPQQDDVVVLCAGTTLLTSPGITVGSGWINPLGGNTIAASDAHSQCCVYHVVTAAEQSAVTTAYTATNLWNSNPGGSETHGLVLRGVDPANIVDAAASAFSNVNTATPHMLAGLTGASLSTGSLVVSFVIKDQTGAYSAAPTGWTLQTTSNTTQGMAGLTRDALTTAGTDVTATAITPSAGDEYTSITVAFTAAP